MHEGPKSQQFNLTALHHTFAIDALERHGLFVEDLHLGSHRLVVGDTLRVRTLDYIAD